MAKRYLILGTGIAGFSAAAEIRALDETAEITMVGAEKEKTYLRPLLSKTDIRTFQRGKTYTADDHWYAEQRIEIITGAIVTVIQPDAHTVSLADGRVLAYEKCIYALGASCFVPPIPGREKQGVLTLRNTEDFHALRRLCMQAKNAVLIGGGIIGMEMAWELHQLGLKCTVLEAAPRLMPRQLDSQSSRLLQERISEIGIPCYTGVQITELTGEDAVNGVKLADGRWFPAEIVILSTGVRAVIAPAIEGGLKCDRGVMTDEYLFTSDRDILAAGDCIQCNAPNPGLWKYALESGRIAGHNAVYPQEPNKFCAGSFPVILFAMGMGLYAEGDTAEGDGITTEVIFSPSLAANSVFRVNQNACGSTSYQKRFYRDGKLVGAVLMGDISGMAEIMNTL